MNSITFKAQDKSNAKRFLVKTCKLENFEAYLTQHEGKWGTWIDGEGKPVEFAKLPSTTEQATTEQATTETASAEEVSPAASAFGAFAVSQLAGDGNTAPAPAATRVTSNSTGLKIQKDRPEQNGVRRQSAGSVGDKLWAIYDAIGATCTLEQAKAAAVAAGLSPTSAAIALYNWRKFNGIEFKSASKA